MAIGGGTLGRADVWGSVAWLWYGLGSERRVGVLLGF